MEGARLGGGAVVEEISGDEEEGGVPDFIDLFDEALEEGGAGVLGIMEIVGLEKGEGFAGSISGTGGTGPEAGGEKGAGAELEHLAAGERMGHAELLGRATIM